MPPTSPTTSVPHRRSLRSATSQESPADTMDVDNEASVSVPEPEPESEPQEIGVDVEGQFDEMMKQMEFEMMGEPVDANANGNRNRNRPDNEEGEIEELEEAVQRQLRGEVEGVEKAFEKTTAENLSLEDTTKTQDTPPIGSDAKSTPPAQSAATSDNDAKESSDGEQQNQGEKEEDTPLDVKPAEWSGQVPIFRPTMREFRDFKKFMEHVDSYGMRSGIIKIIPPAKWKDSLPPINDLVKQVRVRNPIKQDIMGSSGTYRQVNFVHGRVYNIPQWRALCDQSEHQPPARRGEKRNAALLSSRVKASRAGRPKSDEVQSTSARRKYSRKLDNTKIDEEAFKDFDYHMDISEFTPERCEELERIYWKTLTYAQPLYGADLMGTLFHEETTEWNLNKLPNLLDVLGTKVPGVNTAYLYLGMWKATFAWHLEDVDLYSINYLHFGAPKQWYSISQADSRRFEAAMRSIWPQEAKACDQFLRHKGFLISPQHLKSHYGITVNKVVSYPGEFVVTYPYGYHSGYNLGYNCAEAVNFALDTWLPMGKIAKKCECAEAQDSVWVDVYEIERKLRGEPDPEEEEFEYVEVEDDEDDEDDQYDEENEERAGKEDHGIPSPPDSSSGRKTNSLKRKQADRPEKAPKDKPAKKVKLVRQPKHRGDVCALCPNSVHGLEVLKTNDGRSVHRLCARYFPETWFDVDPQNEEVDIVGNVLETLEKRNDMKCLFCHSKRGACLQCSQLGCSRLYHASCAVAAGAYVEEGLVPLFGADGKEYAQEAVELTCRFHRVRRSRFESGYSLEKAGKAAKLAARLTKGDICQVQLHTKDVWAGVVVDNRPDEEMIMLSTIPTRDLVEVQWKWVVVPDPTDRHLPVASPDAIPMPRSKKARDDLKATQGDGATPRKDEIFFDGYIWGEFIVNHKCKNPNQEPVYIEKPGNGPFFYIPNVSTETKSYYHSDPNSTKPDYTTDFFSRYNSYLTQKLLQRGTTQQDTATKDTVLQDTVKQELPPGFPVVSTPYQLYKRPAPLATPSIPGTPTRPEPKTSADMPQPQYRPPPMSVKTEKGRTRTSTPTTAGSHAVPSPSPVLQRQGPPGPQGLLHMMHQEPPPPGHPHQGPPVVYGHSPQHPYPPHILPQGFPDHYYVPGPGPNAQFYPGYHPPQFIPYGIPHPNQGHSYGSPSPHFYHPQFHPHSHVIHQGPPPNVPIAPMLPHGHGVPMGHYMPPYPQPMPYSPNGAPPGHNMSPQGPPQRHPQGPPQNTPQGPQGNPQPPQTITPILPPPPGTVDSVPRGKAPPSKSIAVPAKETPVPVPAKYLAGGSAPGSKAGTPASKGKDAVKEASKEKEKLKEKEVPRVSTTPIPVPVVVGMKTPATVPSPSLSTASKDKKLKNNETPSSSSKPPNKKNEDDDNLAEVPCDSMGEVNSVLFHLRRVSDSGTEIAGTK